MTEVQEVAVDAVDALTNEERQEFVIYEREIDGGLKTFVSVGNALRKIRDWRLYRETHTRFDDYVQGRFGMQRGHAYNLIGAVDAVDNLAGVSQVVPTNEYQVRPLVKLSKADQETVWAKAVIAGNGKPTHDLVKAAVEQLEGKTKEIEFTEEAGSAANAELADDYVFGDLAEQIVKAQARSVDLLLISNLTAKRSVAEAETLETILTTAEPVLKEDHQALILCNSHDHRLLLDVAEACGYEIGVPIFRDKMKSQSVSPFSFLNAAQIILHLRKGNAQLYDRVSNMISVEDESPRIHPSQKPLALLSDLIPAAVPPGAMVLDPTAGVGSTVLACRQIGRGCLAIESDEKAYKLGLRQLASDDASSSDDASTAETEGADHD